jgi:photosystem II stability/assembly factor-like uncharacterized protein
MAPAAAVQRAHKVSTLRSAHELIPSRTPAMRNSSRSRLLLSIALFAASLCTSAAVISQTTSQWTTTWESPSNNVDDFPRSLRSSARGHYLLVSARQATRTTDGGLTWTRLLHNGENFLYKFLGGAHPTRDRMVVIADSSSYANNVEVHLGHIYASSDAGATWARLMRQSDGRFTSLSMIDGRIGIIGLFVPSTPNDSILETSDGGVTWRSHALPTGVRNPSDVHAFGAGFWSVRAADVSNDSVYHYRTVDTGRTWSRRPLPPGIKSFHFIDSSTSWAVGVVSPPRGSTDPARDLILRSTDAGASWQTMLDTALESTWGLYDIDFADQSNGLATGGMGKIYRTTDGGVTWVREYAPEERAYEYLMLYEVEYAAIDEALARSTDWSVIAYRGARTLVAPRILEPVTNLSPRPLEATIVWSAVQGATAYDLQIGDTVYEHNTVNHRYFDEPYLERFGLTDTTLDVTLGEHRQYIIRVRARNESQVGDWSPRVRVRTVGDAPRVASPTIIEPADGAIDQPLALDVRWTSVDVAVGYDFTLALEPSFIVTHTHEEQQDGTTMHLAGLYPNTRYYVRVRARDRDGVTSPYSVITFLTDDVSTAPDHSVIAFSATVQPNTASDRTTLRLELAHAGTIGIRIIDAAGAEVLQRPEASLDAGSHLITLDVATLPIGRYFVLLESSGGDLSLPLLIVR